MLRIPQQLAPLRDQLEPSDTMAEEAPHSGQRSTVLSRFLWLPGRALTACRVGLPGPVSARGPPGAHGSQSGQQFKSA